MKLIFPGLFPDNSREDVKRRLKLVLAHDRADLPPQLMRKMQQEILEVISRYVEIDNEGTEFALENDERSTSLIANFPIRRIKNDLPDDSDSDDEFSEFVLDETAIPDPTETEPSLTQDIVSKTATIKEPVAEVQLETNPGQDQAEVLESLSPSSPVAMAEAALNRLLPDPVSPAPFLES